MVSKESLRNQCLQKFRHKDGVLYYRHSYGSRFSIGSEVGSKDGHGYLQVNVNGKVCKVHRLIYLMVNGKYPSLIDHIDRDILNNRPENLREADRSLNAVNSGCHKDSVTGVRNVSVRAGGRGFLVNVSRWGVRKSKVCKTLEEAIIVREEFIREFNSKSDESPT